MDNGPATSVTFTDEESVDRPRIGINYEGNKLYAPMGLGWYETKKGLFSGIYNGNFPALLGLTHNNPVTPSIESNTTFSFKADLNNNTWSIYVKSSVPNYFNFNNVNYISFCDYNNYSAEATIGINTVDTTYYSLRGLEDDHVEYQGTFSDRMLARLKAHNGGKLLFRLSLNYAIPCGVKDNQIQIDDSIEYYGTSISLNHIIAKGNLGNSSPTAGGIVGNTPTIQADSNLNVKFLHTFDYFDELIENVDFYYLNHDTELVKFKEGFTNASTDVPFQLDSIGYYPYFYVRVTIEGKDYWGTIYEGNAQYTTSGRTTSWTIIALYNSEEMNKLVKK